MSWLYASTYRNSASILSLASLHNDHIEVHGTTEHSRYHDTNHEYHVQGDAVDLRRARGIVSEIARGRHVGRVRLLDRENKY